MPLSQNGLYLKNGWPYLVEGGGITFFGICQIFKFMALGKYNSAQLHGAIGHKLIQCNILQTEHQGPWTSCFIQCFGYTVSTWYYDNIYMYHHDHMNTIPSAACINVLFIYWLIFLCTQSCRPAGPICGAPEFTEPQCACWPLYGHSNYGHAAWTTESRKRR